MQPQNDFRNQIFACRCRTCQSLVRLVKDRGAVLQFSRDRAGRLCELAVVATAGDNGLAEDEVVPARRAYAEHLGIELRGPISNADKPIHIRWAIQNSNHNRNAMNRINLGQAMASFMGGRFRLR